MFYLSYIMEEVVSKEYVIVENIDIVTLKEHCPYFKLFDYKIPPKNKLRPNIVWEKEMPVYIELVLPKTESFSDYKTFFKVISEYKLFLPRLLSILNVYSIFILADFFCVEESFNEIFIYYAHNLTLSPVFMKCFFKYWGPNHDSTINFYFHRKF